MLKENSLCLHGFIFFSNNTMTAPVLCTCTAQFCCPCAFVLLVALSDSYITRKYDIYITTKSSYHLNIILYQLNLLMFLL